ncbi:protein translocase subunit SecF [Fodinisporobacter ferrooxydans]|uniref:Protein-export membrane protein SecF n=1 Tax=Fodinisporobacter ferrooxydans TaxID=2901836 RepID=A0ABY4CHF4_9BACL|nr:protein translocase subunit SecF [Alicyclobacillaceae bacterium MYW30-H2]
MKFEIVRNRKWFFLLSGLITVAGIIVMLLFGLNLGTDFVAGTRVQVDLNQTFQESQVLNIFKGLGYKVSANDITTAGTDQHTAVIRLRETISTDQENKIDDALKKQFPHEKGTQVDTVSPIVAKELSKNAFYAVLFASVGIVIYVAIRFEYRFGVSGIIALLHDAFIVISVFALLRLEVDIPFIAAVLTIVGYSINDTIVIFDRIRENLKNQKVKTLSELETLVNHSLWQTMTRSINTVLTVIFADAMLFFFGGTSIHNFTFALLVGLISGAYSSIFIASPIWVVWRSRSLKKQS